jgi:post-segregation antitoxin (ccd killing protein)
MFDKTDTDHVNISIPKYLRDRARAEGYSLSRLLRIALEQKFTDEDKMSRREIK